jgi:hypothetical protein
MRWVVVMVWEEGQTTLGMRRGLNMQDIGMEVIMIIIHYVHCIL